MLDPCDSVYLDVAIPVGQYQEQLMDRVEIGTFTVLVALVIMWAALGPGGWVSGMVGAVVGLGVAAVLVLRRRRASNRR